jgi:two-component system osmolarity sensor histidine kinase EnvZ
MPRTLVGRTALLILGLIVVAQCAGLVVFHELVQKPRAAELADLASDYVDALIQGLETLAPAQRQAFIDRLRNERKVEIYPVSDRSPDILQIRNPLWQQYAHNLAQQLRKGPQDVVWSADHQGSLWVRERIGGQDYWLVLRGVAAGSRLPRLALLLSALIVLLALSGAWLLQRRINRPLRRLSQTARALARGRQPLPLPEEPPEEIAIVTRAFNQMIRGLAATEQERAVMLAGVSHDLRTPLSKVRLAIEIMAERIEPELLAGLRASLAQIELIIDQFLDYGRLHAGEAATLTDLSALIEECCATRPFDEPVFALSLAELPSFPAQRRSLARALGNLMDNAVRYGAPPFTIATRRAGEMVQIQVTDAGPGIPPQEIDAMRQPFRRGSSARAGVAGSGLGLAIVDRVTQLHGGTLHLSNRPEGGVSAQMELPLSGAGAPAG